MASDPYQELGVARGASGEEIRKAFRKLAKQFHPDQNPNDKAAEERFKRVSAAFDILGDADKRKKFDAGQIDADGRESFRGFRPGSGPGGSPFGQGGFRPGAGGAHGGFEGANFEGTEFGDILSEMFGRGAAGGAGRAGFGGFGGGGPPPRGQDVRAELAVTVEEAVNGGKRRISFSDGRTLDVSIPKGAAEGQVLRLKGQGGQGRGGAGDALIEIHIAPHAIYRREGANLVMDVPVSVPDAVLGGKVEAPTPDGPVTLTVPKGANSGQTLRLKGRGLGDAGSGKRGDLLARLVVTLPDGPDPMLEQFAEAWRSERPYTPKRKA